MTVFVSPLTTKIIAKPDQRKIDSHGILAYVSDDDRKAILALPAGHLKVQLNYIRKQIAEARRGKKTGR